jgi:hypothetical protein
MYEVSQGKEATLLLVVPLSGLSTFWNELPVSGKYFSSTHSPNFSISNKFKVLSQLLVQ